MIEIKNLEFFYNSKNPIFKNLNYKFYDGRFYVISGANGVGKTTLIKLILGLLAPINGFINNTNNIIGYLPDYNGIYENLTVLENIKFRIGIYNKSYVRLKNTIEDLLNKYNIYKYKNCLVKNLSFGTQKKLALICAYIINPDLLILDEPTSGLDNNSKKELIEMLVSYNNQDNKNYIVLCISHDQMLIDEINANTLLLKNGELFDE